VGRNLTRVGITDDGALDVKDVLRFERLLFTTAAYDALTQRLAEKQEQADGRS
jgi:ribosomal protein L4